MPRPLEAAFEAELVKASGDRTFLLSLDVPSGVVRLTTWRADLPWNGATYLGDGRFAGFDKVEERTDLGPTVTMLAFLVPRSDPLFVSLRDEAIQGRQARMHLGLFDAAGSLLVDPNPVLAGEMAAPTFAFDPRQGPTVGLAVAGPFNDDRPRERRWTDEDQKAEHPGDKGLEFATELAYRPVKPQRD